MPALPEIEREMNKSNESRRVVTLRGGCLSSVTMMVRNLNLFEMGPEERELITTITDALDRHVSQGTLASVPPQAE